ncbi:hypothetical protein [Chondromyces crocatus]|uniref:Uncharacterized protein n=1 Tax=Chondromyces crocatus TaxID=52 RepID=A0A0K1EGV1_CHOCO|nr:hypothetical protein [Chondromyces crocatus]AKT40086.1 uncharacterized protein CMC5_042390 [Chondromyces crocatus]
MRAEATSRWIEPLSDGAAPSDPGRRTAEVVTHDGDIDVLCPCNLGPKGAPVQLAFQAYDHADPPFSIRIKAPSGKVVVERVVRDEALTGRTRGISVDFRPDLAGDYSVEVKQVYGELRGKATLRVRFS